ncbi:MAG: hypothetical protein GY856_10405 [bacterium]|nr:hypothetical protein [bacterium]
MIPDAHHGTSGLENAECIWNLEREFLERGSVVGLDTSCVDTMRRRSFFTDRTELDHYLNEMAADL